MKEKSGKQRAFRPWPENAARLDYAENVGINLSEVINQVLKDHLKPYLVKARDDRLPKLREAMNAPVP